MNKSVQFETSKPEFVKVLRKRVNIYFKENNKSKNSNFSMHFKTVFMLSLFFVPFILLTINVVDSWWFHIIMWSLMGFGMAGWLICNA